MGCSPHMISTCRKPAKAGWINWQVLSNNGQLHAALDDARADGVTGEAGGVVDVELLHEMFAMLLDGLDADAKLVRRFLVRLPFGDQLQHFHLDRKSTRLNSSHL